MKFEATYLSLPAVFYQKLPPTPVRGPSLLLLNETLARELGLSQDFLTAPFLSGNQVWPGTEPFAQAYAGHQFGHLNILGDGRAHVLGEWVDGQGRRLDLQLKGSGPTAFSRGGDGRAALGPMLREYIMSEALHGLGIPTTRSLAVVRTEETVMRESPRPGGVLTRVATSHLRVGTFEFAALRSDFESLRALADYAIQRHDPDLTGDPHRHLGFLRAVIRRQAHLIARWMNFGFIHGVMNTDNMSISGQTIDFGPCALMDEYNLQTVFSSIDRRGRYAFGNQPAIAQWNLARLAESLLPLLSPDEKESVREAEKALAEFPGLFAAEYFRMLFSRVALPPSDADESAFFAPFFSWLEENKLDYTHTFRQLCREIPTEGVFAHDAFVTFKKQWLSRLQQQGSTLAQAQQQMRKTNPAIIARNYFVEEAIDAAETRDDLAPLKKLVKALSTPFTENADTAEFQQLRPGHSENYRTFCGT